ncbi:MAG: hypothetical protein H6Q73_2555 [Firmicutes bacterium]|nr:hypothetical protein [Bacillota bacterium]
MARKDDILREISQDFETAAEWLLFYEDRKKQYYSDLNYIRDERSMPEVFVRTGTTGNVVIQKVISLEELEQTEKWLLTVELVESILGPKKKTFLAIRREARRKNRKINGHEVWRGYVQRRFAEEMSNIYQVPSDKFWLSEDSITLWWKNMVATARLLAYKTGCRF